MRSMWPNARRFQKWISEIPEETLQLTEKGFVKLPFHIGHPEILRTMMSYGTEKLSRLQEIKSRQIQSHKNFWTRLTDDDANKNLPTSHPLVNFALQEEILQIVSAYLGEPAFLEYAILTYSEHTPPPFKVSQLWHVDRDHRRMVKLFVYLTDVNDLTSGPFTFLEKGKSEKVRGGFVKRHLNDETMNLFINSDEIIQMFGSKGSTFLVDTSRCYHMGSRVQQGASRLMYTASYTGRPSIYPTAKHAVVDVDTKLSDLQTLAVRDTLKG